MNICSSCGVENLPTQKFCGECGSPLVFGATQLAELERSADVQERCYYGVASAEILLAERDRAEALSPQFLNAQVARFRACGAAGRRQSQEADRLFKRAGGLFHDLAVPFQLAVARVEHAEWLMEHGRIEEAEPLLGEAREIVERKEAQPWLDRVARARAEPAAAGVPA